MLEDGAARTDAGGALRQGFAPLPPLLAVEFIQGGASFVLLLALAAGQNLEQGMSHWIVLIPCRLIYRSSLC